MLAIMTGLVASINQQTIRKTIWTGSMSMAIHFEKKNKKRKHKAR